MTDNEYLEKIIRTYQELDQLVPTRPLAIYNLDQKIIFSSMSYKTARGGCAIEGGHGLPDDSGKYTQQQSRNEEKIVLSKRKVIQSINFNFYDGKVQPYTTTKSPLINKNSDNVVGIHVVLQKIMYTNIKFSLLKALEIYDLPLKDYDLSKYKLTKRECQVVFLFLNGLTSQEIASVLSKADGKELSKSAIDAVFSNQLRVKFDVYSRESLYQELIRLGFYRMIPNDLMVNIKLQISDVEIY